MGWELSRLRPRLPAMICVVTKPRAARAGSKVPPALPSSYEAISASVVPLRHAQHVLLITRAHRCHLMSAHGTFSDP